jgi:hypothetical protein
MALVLQWFMKNRFGLLKEQWMTHVKKAWTLLQLVLAQQGNER